MVIGQNGQKDKPNYSKRLVLFQKRADIKHIIYCSFIQKKRMEVTVLGYHRPSEVQATYDELIKEIKEEGYERWKKL